MVWIRLYTCKYKDMIYRLSRTENRSGYIVKILANFSVQLRCKRSYPLLSILEYCNHCCHKMPQNNACYAFLINIIGAFSPRQVHQIR